MEIKKYVLIPNSDWKILKNGVIQEKKVHTMPRLPIREMAKKYHTEYRAQEARPKSRLNSTTIQDFIGRTKKMVSKEKILPVNLKRAMLLSDIFTEKRNQLKFQKALKKVSKELLDEENRRINIEDENFQLEQSKKKLAQKINKVALGKRLKNEILELHLKKLRERIDEVKQEHEEISKRNYELEIETKQSQLQVIEKKRIIDQMNREYLQAKQIEEETLKSVEKEELKVFDAQLKFIHKTNDIRKEVDKMINVRKPSVTECSKVMPKEVIERYYDLPVIKKSKLEEKRDLNAKLLKQQRIEAQELEVQEMMKRSMLSSKEKESEYQRRCENLKVTKLFEQSKRRRLLEIIKEYRKIWNNQCDEKRVMGEKSKQEDVTRRENLLQKIRQEDDEYITNVKAILNEYQKQDKIIIPILKCLKEGYC